MAKFLELIPMLCLGLCLIPVAIFSLYEGWYISRNAKSIINTGYPEVPLDSDVRTGEGLPEDYPKRKFLGQVYLLFGYIWYFIAFSIGSLSLIIIMGIILRIIHYLSSY